MIKYFVNEEKRTVVAKFENTFVLADKGVWKKYIANHICKTISKTKGGIDLYLNERNIYYNKMIPAMVSQSVQTRIHSMLKKEKKLLKRNYSKNTIAHKKEHY